MLMHSLDTVKTRQQGDPHLPSRYTTMSSTYSTIFRQEGVARGLYSGVTPALLGSFPGTVLFFGVYEWSKRRLNDNGVAPSLSYLTAGFFADLVASVIYVPSEVLKTRMQLQGRYNNPFFHSGYNYRSTWDAAHTIARTEGVPALFHGYRATLWRDLPFSAFQFAIYEKARRLAMRWTGSRDIGIGFEICTAMAAGGIAGTLTCPLDVVKTRIQTQQKHPTSPVTLKVIRGPTTPSPTSKTYSVQTRNTPNTANQNKLRIERQISTSSPKMTIPKPGARMLDTNSVITGLRLIYKTEGLAGWFRGVGPRAVWTSVQTGTMLVCYQAILKKLEHWNVAGLADESRLA